MTSKYRSKILAETIAEIHKHGGVEAVAKRSGIPVRTIESLIYYGVTPSISNVEKVLDGMGLELLIFEKE